MSYSLEEKVENFAVVSRLGLITLQFFTNCLVPDHNAGVFQKPSDAKYQDTILDSIIKTLFGGLTRWDGQYFLHIAHYGYTYENTLAFFPFFPMIIRQLNYLMSYIFNDVLGTFLPLKDFISTESSLILLSVLFNNYIFVQTATILYKLSLVVLKNEKLAYISSILFCVNPASIFFSAVYSESLYCFLIFYALLKIEEKNALVNYVLIGLTTLVRSNGFINIGFLVYKFVKLKCTTEYPFFYTILFNFGIVLAIFPFLGYQFYCFAKFCLPTNETFPGFVTSYGVENRYVFPGSSPFWCKSLVPFAYTYIQKHYWNVGYLKYYEVKQIPNFLLAAPIIFIVLRGTFSFLKEYRHLILYMGFVNEPSKYDLPVTVFPYVIHAFGLTVFCIFIVHIQVTTRLLSSSNPIIYWYCAHVISSCVKDSVEGKVLKMLKKKDEIKCYYESCENKKSRWRTFLCTESFTGYSYFIKWYFLLYFFVGTFMFSNYLPWT